MKANMYNDLNPKYMELYSRNPPKIAPSIFDESATATDADFFNSEENANPEKNSGRVNIIVINIWLLCRGKTSDFTKVNNNPNSNDINRPP